MESPFKEELSHFVSYTNTALCLGSHTGVEAMLMAKLVGPSGNLFIMEPHSVAHQLLVANIQLGGFEDRTRIFKVAASDRQGTASLHINYSNTAIRQLNPINDSFTPSRDSNGELEQVTLDLVDKVLPERTGLDFAFVDLYGMGVDALMGMKKTIQNSPDLVILVNWNSEGLASQRDKIQDLLDMFQGLSYSLAISN